MSHGQSALVALACITLAGCNRNDTECLARIGRKIVEHAEVNADSLREKVGPSISTIARPTSLREKVQERLTWEKQLADVRIEVIVSDNEVELKGALKSEEQRRRAVDIAETTVGVQKVNDNLQVSVDPLQ